MSDATIVRETEPTFGAKIDTGIPTARRYDLGRADAEGYEALFRVQQEAQINPPTPCPSPMAVLNGTTDLSSHERVALARERYAESVDRVTEEPVLPEVERSPSFLDVLRDLTDDEKQRREDAINAENVKRESKAK